MNIQKKKKKKENFDEDLKFAYNNEINFLGFYIFSFCMNAYYIL